MTDQVPASGRRIGLGALCVLGGVVPLRGRAVIFSWVLAVGMAGIVWPFAPGLVAVSAGLIAASITATEIGTKGVRDWRFGDYELVNGHRLEVHRRLTVRAFSILKVDGINAPGELTGTIRLLPFELTLTVAALQRINPGEQTVVYETRRPGPLARWLLYAHLERDDA